MAGIWKINLWFWNLFRYLLYTYGYKEWKFQLRFRTLDETLFPGGSNCWLFHFAPVWIGGPALKPIYNLCIYELLWSWQRLLEIVRLVGGPSACLDLYVWGSDGRKFNFHLYPSNMSNASCCEGNQVINNFHGFLIFIVLVQKFQNFSVIRDFQKYQYLFYSNIFKITNMDKFRLKHLPWGNLTDKNIFAIGVNNCKHIFQKNSLESIFAININIDIFSIYQKINTSALLFSTKK